MKATVLARITSVLVPCAALCAQTGTLDQTSPYPPPPQYSTVGYNGSTSWLIWQQQVRTGLAGQLEGFELHLNGSQGSTMDARIRVGDGWNTSPVAFQALVVKQTTSFDEIYFVDCTSANLVFTVGQTFVIELQGHDDGGGFVGNYAPVPLSPLYPEELYLDPGQPACYADCRYRLAFSTYVVGSAPPTVYCTAGTTTNGCNANISASGNPNVTHGSPCQINIAGVEGQKTGIMFYGLSALPQPWCSLGGGSSFLCVKPPTLRTGTQSSGGTGGQCNGSLALDWNAFQLATPGALGQPWTAGSKAFVQGWFRDPPACKTTSLSNAIELTYQP